VARGDLGVELPPETLPVTQDALVELARLHCKPVIIATQMLDSMIRNPRPTRAEVSDVAHAVQTGADAVMLSGETAVGAFPMQTVEMMDRVIRHAEGRLWHQGAFGSLSRRDERSLPMTINDALSKAVTHLSRDLEIRTILVVSRSGQSGVTVSAARPAAPVLAVSSDLRVCRFLNLCWGIVPTLVEAEALDDPVGLLRRLVHEMHLAEPLQMGLIVKGFRAEVRDNLPSVTVVTI